MNQTLFCYKIRDLSIYKRYWCCPSTIMNYFISNLVYFALRNSVAAQEKYMMAVHILKELSPSDAVFFENKIAKVKSDDKKKKKLIIFLAIMFVIIYVVLFSTGVLEFN